MIGSSLVVRVGQWDADLPWDFRVVIPVEVPGAGGGVVVVVQPPDVGVGGEEGGEYDGVCYERDVLCDEKLVVVVEDDHGDDGGQEDQHGEA